MGEEYYVYPVVDGEQAHTDDHLFCDDMSCPCHEDSDNLQALGDWADAGLIGSTDGMLYYTGRTV